MKSHYTFLDSSRGLCALSVVLWHYILGYALLYPSYQHINNSMLHFFWNGDSAVCYFFVLSGFVLSVSFFNGQKNILNLNIKGYLVQRFFRIYPLFFVCLLISFLLQMLLLLHNPIKITAPLQSEWLKGLWVQKRTFLDLAKEALLIVSMPPESYLRLLPQDWSLNREIWFSILIPLLILLLKKGETWFLLLFLFLYISNYNSTILCFFLGVLLAKYHIYFTAQIAKWHIILKVLLLFIGCICYTSPFGILSNICTNHAIRTGMLQPIGATILLMSLLSFKKLQIILNNTVLVFLGKISYGIYLVHFFILLGIIPFICQYLNKTSLISNEIVLNGILLLLLIGLTIAFAFTFYNPIEKKFNTIGKQLAKKYFP